MPVSVSAQVREKESRKVLPLSTTPNSDLMSLCPAVAVCVYSSSHFTFISPLCVLTCQWTVFWMMMPSSHLVEIFILKKDFSSFLTTIPVSGLSDAINGMSDRESSGSSPYSVSSIMATNGCCCHISFCRRRCRIVHLIPNHNGF